MPYDALSVGVIVSSAALFGFAARGNFPFRVRRGCVLLAAVLIRADAITQFSLHPRDERFHALVARNLIAHPLVPTLYRDALLPTTIATGWQTTSGCTSRRARRTYIPPE